MDPTWHSQPNADYYIPPPDDDFSPDMIDLLPFDESVYQLQSSADPASSSRRSRASADPQPTTSRTTMGNSPQSMSSAFDFTTARTSSPFVNPSQANASSEDIWLFNPATGEVGATASPEGAPKRSRGSAADSISACWTSPLCPNKKDDGGLSNSCKGECADFLFEHPSELPEDKKILLDLLAKSQPRVVLEPPQRGSLKRQDMESTPDDTGRDLNKPSSPVLTFRTASTIPDSSSSTTAPTALPDDDAPTACEPAAASKSKGRVPHKQVEKRYRTNVNAQLEALRRVVPVSKQQLVGFDGLDMEDLAAAGSINAARQPSKAVVLSSATAYIKQLENDNARLQEEIRALKGQNNTLQSLVKCDDCSLMKYVKRWKIQGPA
jgi:hypothetical protein